jgi:hypothetical protein
VTHVVHTVLVLLAAGAVVLAAYWRSLKRDPWRPCHRCGGSGQHRNAIWTYATGDCGSRKCVRGRKLRLGCRIFGIDPTDN